jgi:hypothetical protein
MATTSRKGSRIFFHSKEATAGTADTYAFFEGRSVIADMPPATYLFESDKGKLGAGEHGTKAELQALYTPVTFKCTRLSEIAFFMSYFQGIADTPSTRTTGVYLHELKHLAVGSRTLPTFTFDYGNTVTAMDVFTHCIINEFNLSFKSGGNGVIDATFSGWANLHKVTAGVLTRNSTANNSSFTGTSFASEPLVNYHSTKFWTGTALEATPLVPSNVAISASDLGSASEITSYVNSVTITGNNGMTAEDLIRAGGSGILNVQERGDRAYTCEVQVRKNTDYPALALAGTQKAFEIQFEGPVIGATAYTYGLNLFFPVLQFTGVTEDGGSPINETLGTEIFQDSSGDAFYAYAQSAFASGYNTTNT